MARARPRAGHAAGASLLAARALALRAPAWEFCAAPGTGPAAVPRVVHQTYKNRTLPERLRGYRESWLRALPGWEHRLWLDEDNRNLIRDYYPWFLSTYDGYDQTIKRVDAARLFIMHRHGGVYADTDVEALRDPQPLFAGRRDLFFFAQAPVRCGRAARVQVPQHAKEAGAIPNALMASVAGHPFWLFLAEKLVKSRGEQVLWATGPTRLTEALASYQADHPEARVAVYEREHWSPFKWGEAGCEGEACGTLFPDAYLISHWTGTWNHCEQGTCLEGDVLQAKLRRTPPSAAL